VQLSIENIKTKWPRRGNIQKFAVIFKMRMEILRSRIEKEKAAKEKTILLESQVHAQQISG
jgi:CRISPR/Cas system-associated protein endoribonuclease Cas2